MMQRTDRHFRVFMRHLTRQTLLYTEMVTTPAIIHGQRELLLGFDPIEHPIALQLGGDDPVALTECAKIAADWGYDEINLNVGCPSDRVQDGRFGACLMARPERVAECVSHIRTAVDLPVTVKHRIGIDDLDAYSDLLNFVDVVAAAGCDRFSVHARKAWLKGLSPKQNRTVPPLRYDDVYRLKAERPALHIEINGGVLDVDQAQAHLAQVDAVMIGRAVYEHPYCFATVDSRLFGVPDPGLSQPEVIEAMFPYVTAWTEGGGRLHSITRHLIHLFSGQRGARRWRQTLSTEGVKLGAGVDVLQAALSCVTDPR